MMWPTKLPLIAILRGIRPDEVLDHVGALVDAGFDAIEIPLNSPDWQESIRLALAEYGSRALIGAGTVLQADDVDLLAGLGARLLVSPNTDVDVIRRAVGHKLVTCIGCMTATEAFVAIKAGARNLKFFPAGELGPNYLKAVLTVLPKSVPVFAVGGVTPENLAQYLAVGCIGAGLGSDLYRAGQPLERTREKARAFVAAWHNFQEATV
ncbi:2-dehydro-3-deoxy-6-phosphogalactonate aldolase [Paludibacterium yongneupense]|uniref:2-dehydro-3-deoxy-6-phosphogalactonate aldolase n=1 Tax=Paludibacterium yongneupense TaxID=400061 RepID=UPI000422048C|nr:2-dehydro-3-deoxy-6-phosphogalactonate aldolase [Paludibacterium yongneupense]